jgi:ribosomal protein L11 methylase PrmA
LEPKLQKDVTTFSFGENWLSYLNTVSIAQQSAASEDIHAWLGADGVEGKRIIDIGCGSGIHSLAFYRMGAEPLVSFDADISSVEATQKLWKEQGAPVYESPAQRRWHLFV